MLLQSSKTALAAAVLASATMLAPSAAQAGPWGYGPPAYYQPYSGTTSHDGAVYPGGYAPAYYGHPQPVYGYGYGGGYDPAYGYPAYGYGYPVYRKRRSNAGAALAAGLIGGMALGAIIAGSQRGYARSCVVSRRALSPSGRPYLRRVRVC
jgi:hypothetical protein